MTRAFLECEVTKYKGYPTMVLSFANEHAAEKYSEAVVDKLGIPFCQALENYNALLLLQVGDMASVYACDTRKFSEWVRVGRS